LISAHCGSQALGPALRIPSPGSLTSPLPLGSVRTEISSVEFDAVSLLSSLSAEPLCRDADREERNDRLHPILIGGEDLKRIADQIERSFLDPIGAQDDVVRIDAVGEDHGRAFAYDSPAPGGEESSANTGLRVASRISTMAPQVSLPGLNLSRPNPATL
jgi:hypothetical protein